MGDEASATVEFHVDVAAGTVRGVAFPEVWTARLTAAHWPVGSKPPVNQTMSNVGTGLDLGAKALTGLANCPMVPR